MMEDVRPPVALDVPAELGPELIRAAKVE